jgi:hypothetical protein
MNSSMGMGRAASPSPSLDAVAAEPTQVGSLTFAVTTALLARNVLVQGVLVARLLALQVEAAERQDQQHRDDKLLTAAETAGILGVTPRWLYRHAQRLPFARRLSRKVLRFSEVGAHKYAAARRG